MIRDFGIEGVYIVHAMKGYELHEARIKILFEKHGLPYEFITDGDPSTFTGSDQISIFVLTFDNLMPDGIVSVPSTTC